jgi:hypothetical protein
VIADRGEDAREEVDFAPRLTGEPAGRGANFGWDCREGSIGYSGDSSETCSEVLGFTDPVFDYPDDDPGDGSAHGCSIVGGYVVRDESVPDLYGRYLYGDYCVGAVRSIDLTAANPRSTDRIEPQLGVTPSTLYSFGEDSCGRVYVVTRIGTAFRVVGSQPNACGLFASASRRKARSRHRTVVRLRAWHGSRDLSIVRLNARVKPCAENRRRRLILKRDGRRTASRKVTGRCVLGFRARVGRRASFRAVLRRGRGAGPARSRAVVVRGSPRP